MATPQEKLAESLEVLHALQERGVVAIRTGDLTRTLLERLLASGFLQKVNGIVSICHLFWFAVTWKQQQRFTAT